MSRMSLCFVGVLLTATLLTEVRGDFLIYRPWGGGQGGRSRGMRGQGTPPGARGMQPGAQDGMSGQDGGGAASFEVVLPGTATFNGRIVSFKHTTFKDQLNF